MSTTYTPDNTGDPVLSYTEPQDGDAPDVASVNVFLEGLADDVSRVALGGAVDYVEDRALQFVWTGVTETALASYWTIGNTGQPVQGGAAAALPLLVHVDLPHGGELTGVALVIDPANGHAGAGAGLTFPTLKFWKVALSSGTRTQIGSTTTDTWNAGLYENAHPIAVTGLTETIDRDLYRYVLEFTGEAGANYVANLSVIGPTCTGNFRRLMSPGG
jgi:hypothetical protein